MSKPITEVTTISINIVYALGGLVALFSVIGTIASSYAFYIVNSVKEAIKELKIYVDKEDEVIKETLRHHWNMHEEHYGAIHQLEKDHTVVATKFESLLESHKENHSGKK